jgi:hypothetical protein
MFRNKAQNVVVFQCQVRQQTSRSLSPPRSRCWCHGCRLLSPMASSQSTIYTPGAGKVCHITFVAVFCVCVSEHGYDYTGNIKLSLFLSHNWTMLSISIIPLNDSGYGVYHLL